MLCCHCWLLYQGVIDFYFALVVSMRTTAASDDCWVVFQRCLSRSSKVTSLIRKKTTKSWDQFLIWYQDKILTKPDYTSSSSGRVTKWTTNITYWTLSMVFKVYESINISPGKKPYSLSLEFSCIQLWFAPR